MDKFQNLTLKSPHTPIEYKTWSVFKYDFDMTIVLISQIQIFLIIFRRISIIKEIFFVFFPKFICSYALVGVVQSGMALEFQNA